MLKRWVRTAVLEVPYGRVRLLLLLLWVLFLVLGQIFADPGDWRFVALVAGVLLVGGGAWPLPVVLGQAVMLVVAALESEQAVGAVSTLAGVALFDLAVRRPFRQAAIGAIALSAAYVVVAYHTEEGILGWIVGDVVNGGVVVPLLLGVWLRVVLARSKERRQRAERTARQVERTEIARELHDLVAHHVASMALRAGIARAVVPDLDPQVRAVLDDVHGSAKTALAGLRRLVAVLRDPSKEDPGSHLVHVEPADLPAAVAAVIDGGAQAGLKVDRHVDPAIATLDPVRGLAVLRLVQEGLTNVAKHAVGARATVRVNILDGRVRVEVTDDGGAPGRQPLLPAAESGYGLIGLRERVEVIGGALTAGRDGDGQPGGWRLHATFPVAAGREP